MVDLDKGGPKKRYVRLWMGPSLGWLDAPETVFTVVGGGTTIIDQSTTLVMVNFGGAVTIQLPSAFGIKTNLGTLTMLPITIVDISGAAATNPITILPAASETIIGLASVQITTNFGAITLIPNTDLGGWYRQQ